TPPLPASASSCRAKSSLPTTSPPAASCKCCRTGRPRRAQCTLCSCKTGGRRRSSGRSSISWWRGSGEGRCGQNDEGRTPPSQREIMAKQTPQVGGRKSSWQNGACHGHHQSGWREASDNCGSDGDCGDEEAVT